MKNPQLDYNGLRAQEMTFLEEWKTFNSKQSIQFPKGGKLAFAENLFFGKNDKLEISYSYLSRRVLQKTGKNYMEIDWLNLDHDYKYGFLSEVRKHFRSLSLKFKTDNKNCKFIITAKFNINFSYPNSLLLN